MADTFSAVFGRWKSVYGSGSKNICQRSYLGEDGKKVELDFADE